MALHRTPAEHDADPPSGWVVAKAAERTWHLRNASGTLQSFATRREAEEAKARGFLVDLYEQEGRWFRGEPVRGWKPYAPSA